MASDHLVSRSCPTCHSIMVGNEKGCSDPWHNPIIADFEYKADLIPEEIKPDPGILASLQYANATYGGTFDTPGTACPSCARNGYTFGCQDPMHDAPMPIHISLDGSKDALDALRAKLAGNVDAEGYNEDGTHMTVHTRPDPEARLQRWADVAMWQAPPDPDPQSGPRVTLLNMTPLPVQTMAAAAALYRGEIVRNARAVSVKDALHWLRQTQLSRASQSQLEFVDLHFLIENVTRAFTHQLVRQRVGATYVQESLRFAVKGNAAFEIALPPFFDGLKDDHPLRIIWNRAVASNSWAYNAMVDGGVPAEDARGLLPTNITTRIHYKTTLRGLVEHAGLRLCSQAQHEWKQVWDGFINAILEYGPAEEEWQQKAVASLFRPICYNTGKCEFMGASDRFCPIRERVQAHHAKGEGQENWVDIHPLEALRYGAARVSPDVAK